MGLTSTLICGNKLSSQLGSLFTLANYLGSKLYHKIISFHVNQKKENKKLNGPLRLTLIISLIADDLPPKQLSNPMMIRNDNNLIHN